MRSSGAEPLASALLSVSSVISMICIGGALQITGAPWLHRRGTRGLDVPLHGRVAARIG